MTAAPPKAAAKKLSAPKIDRKRWPYRMKDLSQLTGLPRQVIHFYVQQGLLPEGRKTGRNMAYYGPEHLERIELIRKLQHERFLPLKAIRAVLHESKGGFTKEQRQFLSEIKHRLGPTLGGKHSKPATVDVAALLARAQLDAGELSAFVELGAIATSQSGDGRVVISKEDAWMIELLGELRALGFSKELGFGVEAFSIFEEAISTMFEREQQLLTSKLDGLPPQQVAQMLEGALPLIHTFLARYHETKLRNFFALM